MSSVNETNARLQERRKVVEEIKRDPAKFGLFGDGKPLYNSTHKSFYPWYQRLYMRLFKRPRLSEDNFEGLSSDFVILDEAGDVPDIMYQGSGCVSRQITGIYDMPSDVPQCMRQPLAFLRQWLNEDRKCTPLVSNKDLWHWLKAAFQGNPKLVERAVEWGRTFEEVPIPDNVPTYGGDDVIKAAHGVVSRYLPNPEVHPNLNNWLFMLIDQTYIAHTYIVGGCIRVHCSRKDAVAMNMDGDHVIQFDLHSGQPDTWGDYKTICEIAGLTEDDHE